eukprot:tig00021352_g20695.t1
MEIVRRKEALRLYKSFMQLAIDYGVAELRPQASLRPYILNDTRSRFRANAGETAGERIDELIDEGKKELVALRKILDNTAKRRHPRTETPEDAARAARARVMFTQDGEGARELNALRPGILDALRSFFGGR